MDRLAPEELGFTLVAMRLVVWFIAGLAASAVLIVVVPPMDVLLLVLLVALTVALRVRHGRFSPCATPMFVGAVAFSVYALIWALILGSPGPSYGTGSGVGLILSSSPSELGADDPVENQRR